MKMLTYEQFENPDIDNEWLQEYYKDENLTWNIILRNGKSYPDDRPYPELYKVYVNWYSTRFSKLGRALL
jgi:hypothetical protein